MTQTWHCSIKAWSIWFVAASFYSFEFFLRISPSVMVDDLMREFAVNAAVLGNLSALYYYAYASMQIPAGLMIDKYGIRPLLTFAAILVAFGSVLFAATNTLLLAEIGRICMGIGSAFSFIGCLKLARNWFAQHQLAVVIGLTNTLGVIGALSAGAPLALLVNAFGWRETLLLAGIIGAMVALLIRMVVRDKPQALGCGITITQEERLTMPLGIRHLLRCRRTWLTAIYGGLMVAPIAAFTELWSVPFFMHVSHLSRAHAAAISSLVFIGIAIGGPINGWVSEKLKRRKPVLLTGCLGATICFAWILYFPFSGQFALSILLFAFGFFTSSMLLIFAINTEHNTTHVAGVVIGFTNMIVMLGGTIFQPLVGYLLDKNHHQNVAVKIVEFSLTNYQHALFVLTLCQILALGLLFFIKETRCTAHT